MTVTANTYVRIAGKLYAPGDTVSYNLPAVDRKLLVEKGAISVDDTTTVLEADENGPEIVFKPADEEIAETVETATDEADMLDDIVVPAKKKSTRKKG